MAGGRRTADGTPGADPCPESVILADYLDDRLGPGLASSVEDHVEACPACRDRLEVLASTTDEPPRPRPKHLPRTASPASSGVGPPGLPLPPPVRLAPDGVGRAADGPVGAGGRAAALSEDLVESGSWPEIPGFRILREVGRGGMGVVYEAVELALNRRVAPKILSDSSGPTGLAADSLLILPEGRTVVTGDRDGSVRTWDLATGRPAGPALGSSGPKPYGLALSPLDGRTLAICRETGPVELWDLAAGRPIRRLDRGDDNSYTIAFSPDGRLLAVGGQQGAVTLLDPVGDAPPRALRGEAGPEAIRQLGFTRDGSTLIAVDRVGAVTFWEAATGRRIGPEPVAVDNIVDACGPLAISADGSTLAIGLDDGTTQLWDIVAKRPILLLRGHGGQMTSAAFSTDDRPLATGSRDRTIWLWDPSDGSLKTTLAGHLSNVLAVAFSDDGTLLASTGIDGMIRLWYATAPSEPPTTAGETGLVPTW